MNIHPDYPVPTTLEWHPVDEVPHPRTHYHYQFLLLVALVGEPTKKGEWSETPAYRIFTSKYEGDRWDLPGQDKWFEIIGWTYLAPGPHSGVQQLMRAREHGHEDIAKEIEQSMEFDSTRYGPFPATCSRCRGSGQYEFSDEAPMVECDECKGKGKIWPIGTNGAF